MRRLGRYAAFAIPTVAVVGGLLFCLGLGLGVAIVQFRLGPAWRLIAGTEMRLLHTDFMPNWTLVHKEALYRDNPSPMPIVMAGDSLIDYADWGELLQRPDVGNRGITGDTSDGLLGRAGMLGRPGSVVALMIGENDLAAHTPVEEVCSTVSLLLDRLRPDHATVLHATLLTAAPSLNGLIRDLDACERRACERLGTCTFLDLNPSVAPSGVLDPALTFDGFHLNQAGYARWAAALRPVLARLHP